MLLSSLACFTLGHSYGTKRDSSWPSTSAVFASDLLLTGLIWLCHISMPGCVQNLLQTFILFVWWEEYARVSYSLTVLRFCCFFFRGIILHFFPSSEWNDIFTMLGLVVHFVLFCFFEILPVHVALAWNLVGKPSWPRNHRDLPFPASQVLGLQLCATTPSFWCILNLILTLPLNISS